jgi:PAS domain S-box-containing protein
MVSPSPPPPVERAYAPEPSFVQALIGIWRWVFTQGLVDLNPHALQALGWPQASPAVPLQRLLEALHPQDRRGLRSGLIDLIRRGTSLDRPVRYLHADGQWHHALLRCQLEHGSDGRAVALGGLALDVSVEVNQLRQSERQQRRLELATKAAGLGLWSRDLSQRQALWNDQMFALVGRNPALGAPTGSEWFGQIIHPLDREMMLAQRARLIASRDNTQEVEYRIIRPDGEIRWLFNRARHEQIQGEWLLLGVTLDITERKAMQAELLRAKERISLATHGAGIGTWALDGQSGALEWDEQMFLLRGLAPDCGLQPAALVRKLTHPDDIDRIRTLQAQALAQVQACTYEFRQRMPDGQWRWFASRAQCLPDDSGQGHRLLGVNWDINERVSAEAERRQRLLAQTESRAKSEFLARMSHELRTPLNAMLGFTQLLQDQDARSPGRADPQRTLRLGHIRSAAEHLLALMNDALDLSAIDAGQLRMNFEALGVAQIFARVLPMVQRQAVEARVKLRLGGAEGHIWADAMRVRQILLNLLSNAIKYNRPGGFVSLESRPGRDQVIICVADNGRGMNSSQLEHLFEPFNRLGAERSSVQGHGIGLAIAHGLVKGMGGEITVQSAPGKGTRFEIALPAHHAGVEPPLDTPSFEQGEPPASEPMPLSSARILYIEDNPINVLVVEELIRSRTQLTFDSAPSGAEGFAKARQTRPDLVLLDMHLPDCHGTDVLRQLRSDPSTSHITCVALSANNLADDVRAALKAGFDAYWTKPIDFAKFIPELEAALAAGPVTRPPLG